MDALQAILPGIRQRAGAYDRAGDWPAEDLSALASIGAMRWSIAAEDGGEEVAPLETHLRYEQLATASLATALILSQRDSAVSLIDASQNLPLRSKLIGELGNNHAFCTVGIAQITTSRQQGAPALLAMPDGDGFILNGLVPWATGADQCDFIVVASAVAGGGQLLFALPRDLEGVSIMPPEPLVALGASRTTAIRLVDVRLPGADVLTGPSAQVLVNRRKGVPIGQSFLALGLCRSALNLIRDHRSGRAQELGNEFEQQLTGLREKVLRYANAEQPDPAIAPSLRGGCNDLSVRLTHAAVALYKGTALRMDHPRPATGARGDVPAGVELPRSGDRLHGRAVGQRLSFARHLRLGKRNFAKLLLVSFDQLLQ